MIAKGFLKKAVKPDVNELPIMDVGKKTPRNQGKYKKIRVYGDGKQVRDVLYVDDLVNAFNKFIASSLTSSVFNIGGGSENTLSLNELLDIIRIRLEHEVKLSYGPWRNSDQKAYVSDISKACAQLKWKPVISAEEGVDRLWKWAEGI